MPDSNTQWASRQPASGELMNVTVKCQNRIGAHNNSKLNRFGLGVGTAVGPQDGRYTRTAKRRIQTNRE